MMLKYVVLALLAAATPCAAIAQSAATADNPWVRADGRITLASAGLSFPERAGAVVFERSHEFSRQGEGLDNAVQYVSPDRQVFATVYVYYPGLPHAGLAAFMTDRVIAQHAPADFRTLGSRTVAAGGRESVAIRSDYWRFRDGLVSSAAFMKVGRWIVKLRVSGPEGRQEEVRRAMTDLLAGIQFESEAQPRRAAPLAVGDCAPGTDPPEARQRADPAPADIAAQALLATFDGGGIDATEENGSPRHLPSRVPDELCISTEVDLGDDAVVPVLRAADGPALSIDGRTVVIIPMSDSGRTLEVVHATNLGSYLLLFHQIGATSLLAQYESAPSDRQIAELLTTQDHPAGRARAVVELRPSGATEIRIIQEASAPRRPDQPSASSR